MKKENWPKTEYRKFAIVYLFLSSLNQHKFVESNPTRVKIFFDLKIPSVVHSYKKRSGIILDLLTSIFEKVKVLFIYYYYTMNFFQINFGYDYDNHSLSRATVCEERGWSVGSTPEISTHARVPRCSWMGLLLKTIGMVDFFVLHINSQMYVRW